MYRDQAESTEQRIERLERELNVAYQEHDPRSDDAEIGLALLRFRAQRLAKDIEAFRTKQQKEPLVRRLGKRARAFGQSRFGKSLAFVGAFTFGMGLHAHLTRKPPPVDEETARTVAQIEEDIRNSVGATATPAPATTESSDLPCPSSTATADSTAAPDAPYHMHCGDSDESTEKQPPPHPAFSMKDYKELMAKTQAFFRAVRKHDGAALAEMVPPRKDLVLGDEHIQLSASELRDCFTSSRTHLVNISAAEDQTKPQTCAEIFQEYLDAPYERSNDVTFNGAPDLPGYSLTETSAPFVFLYVPPIADEDFSWKGVQLVFERYDGTFSLTAIHKAYWTP